MPSVRVSPALVAGVACLAFGTAFHAQAEEEGSVIQEWQKSGLLAALSDPSREVLKSTILASARDEKVAEILGTLRERVKDQLPRMAEQLKAPELDTRIAAIEALVKLQAKAQLPAIVDLLKDFRVALDKARALGQLGANGLASAMIGLLQKLNFNTRKVSYPAIIREQPVGHGPEYELLQAFWFALSMANARGQLGAREEAPAIAELLQDPEPDVRLATVTALGELGAKEQVPAIAKLLKDVDSHVRWAAVQALVMLQAKEEALAIAELLEDPELTVCLAAVKALRELEAKQQAPAIAELLKDLDSRIRSAEVEASARRGAEEDDPGLDEEDDEDPERNARLTAVEVLGDLGSQKQVPVIVDVLKEHDSAVYQAAVNELARRATEEHGSEGAENLKDQESEFRSSAAKALGKLRAKEAVPVIVDLLKDDDFYVREAAVEALGKLGAKEQAPRIAEYLKDEDPSVREAAVEALGKLGAKEQAPRIAEYLKDEDFEVRSAAIDALEKLGAKEQAPRIAEWLKDEDPSVRRAALKLLGKLGASEQALAIAGLLKDQNNGVRSDAVEVLGTLGAKDQVAAIAERLNDKNFYVRTVAVEALGKLRAKEEVPTIAERLEDEHWYVVGAALEALGSLGAKEQALAIVERFDIKSFLRRAAGLPLLRLAVPEQSFPFRYADVHSAAVEALVKLSPLDLAPILHVLENSYRHPAEAAYVLSLAHFLGGGEQSNEIVISWLGRWPANIEMPVDELTAEPDEARATLEAFKEAWGMSKDLPQLRQDLARSIAVVVNKVSWEASDLPLLEEHEQDLREGGFAEADTVQRVLSAFETRNPIETAGGIWAAHVLFWLSLILMYPRCPQVQAIFFWNPWVRRLLGLGYVGFLLTWIPSLRSILLAPFKESLLADANLDGFDPKTYFEDSPVRLKTSGQTQAITSAIPEIKEHLILQGASGLGKTMFLRHIAQRSKRTLAYLPATNCAGGVLEAIREKLHGYAKDECFLRSLIYSGAIDVCIDGLNEASPDARAEVAKFMKSMKGNFLLGTQELEWTPPAARIYILEPLAREQIEAFLVSRQTALPADVRITGAEYECACRAYLAQALDDKQSREELEPAQRVLSNPMDLTVVAWMIERNKQPDLLRLQEQQYESMADDYRRVNVGHAFPLMRFADQVYQMRTDDAKAIPEQGFKEELLCMERHKMVVRRERVDRAQEATTEWQFRHEKIMEFFIMQTFLGQGNDKPDRHFGDTRFRGVYFLLAMLMPVSEAKLLRDRLNDYAADTKDHSVNDTFIQLLRSRKSD